MAKRISLWLDETSDADEDRWVVSLDEGDVTDTLSSHEDYDDAKAEAVRIGKAKGLSVVEISKHGVETAV